jgi:rhamnogalacturonan endolyase
MDVFERSTADGADVVQWTASTSSTNQQFQLVSTGDGYYRIVARHSGKCVEVLGSSTAAGADVVQYTCNGGNNQSFKFTPVGSSARKMDPAGETDLVVYPNPSHGNFTLVESGKFSYSILDQTGNTVEKGNGENQAIIGEKLSPGVYILNVEGIEKAQNVKLIKN